MWKVDIAKILIDTKYFAKHAIVDVWQGSAYTSGSEYVRDLNMKGFWIDEASEYARVT